VEGVGEERAAGAHSFRGSETESSTLTLLWPPGGYYQNEECRLAGCELNFMAVIRRDSPAATQPSQSPETLFPVPRNPSRHPAQHGI